MPRRCVVKCVHAEDGGKLTLLNPNCDHSCFTYYSSLSSAGFAIREGNRDMAQINGNDLFYSIGNTELP